LYSFSKYEQDIKDKAALKEQNKFYRAIHSVKVQGSDALRNNRQRIEPLSKMVALANKSSFGEKLKGKLEPTLAELVKSTGDGEEPFVDKYGRETHFYVQIDDKRLWIY